MITIKPNIRNTKNTRRSTSIEVKLEEISSHKIPVEKLFRISKGLNTQEYLIQFKENNLFIDIISPSLDSVIFRFTGHNEQNHSFTFSESYISFRKNLNRYYVDQANSSMLITNMDEASIEQKIKEYPDLFFILNSINFISISSVESSSSSSYVFADLFRSYLNMNEDYFSAPHSTFNSTHNPHFFEAQAENLNDIFGVQRQSRHEKMNCFSSDDLIKLLKYFFNNNEKKHYPSAGNLYEIFPLVTLREELNGLSKGTYRITKNELTVNNFLHPENSLNTEIMGQPIVIITLISDFSKIYKRYNNKALRLTIQNSGVLMSAIHHYLCKEQIGSCLYGLDIFSEKSLDKYHYEMGSIYIY